MALNLPVSGSRGMALDPFSWDGWVPFGMWSGPGWAAGSVAAQGRRMGVLDGGLGMGDGSAPSLLNSPEQLFL